MKINLESSLQNSKQTFVAIESFIANLPEDTEVLFQISDIKNTTYSECKLLIKSVPSFNVDFELSGKFGILKGNLPRLKVSMLFNNLSSIINGESSENVTIYNSSV